MSAQACSRSSPSSRRAVTSDVRPFTVIWASGFASRLTTHTGCLGPPKFEPAISQSFPRGTARSGVERDMPDFLPRTVSFRFGSPATSRIVTRPFVTRCSALSVAVIWGSSFGMNERLPIRTASGVSRPMPRA